MTLTQIEFLNNNKDTIIQGYIRAKEYEMDIDLVGLIVAIGMVIGIWVKMETALKAIQTRQDSMEKEVDAIRDMIIRQAQVDDEIRELLALLRVGQEQLDGKISVLTSRMDSK